MSCPAGSVMFSRSVSYLTVLCNIMRDERSTDYISSTSAVDDVMVWASDERQYQSLCPVHVYISRYVPCLDVRWFAMMLINEKMTVTVVIEGRETAYEV